LAACAASADDLPGSPWSDLLDRVLVRLRTRDLVSALDEAEGANRAKNAFLRTVSHELARHSTRSSASARCWQTTRW